MTHGWILDVLADLKAYARKNGLTALAEQLDDTRHVAVAELAQRSGEAALVCIEGGEAVRVANDSRIGGGAA
jgi:hypothetical protein